MAFQLVQMEQLHFSLSLVILGPIRSMCFYINMLPGAALRLISQGDITSSLCLIVLW